MFNKILIANRGEIACRVIQTARQLGIKTVAVYSSVDADARHVTLADEAIAIGPAEASQSYLCGDKIIAAAQKTGAKAIHPGYGFLSENADFSRACEAGGITFIGPPASAIDAMGSKAAAKAIMEAAGVPLVPGYHGTDQSLATLQTEAIKVGYPIMVKAVAGGGGKGMRQVWTPEDLPDSLAGAQREALSSFGDDRVLIEKYLTRPRHVEIQVFCDQLGHGVYLFERDCSLQRRHQKVIEEAPAPGLSADLRRRMGEAAVQAAKAIDYVGAGTVEFLLDEDGAFYFMEMNTRLQVEHPVTEMITGEDLVHWQLLVASGKPLPKTQEQLALSGHAFEARIYAEDPDNDFLPVTGRLHYLSPPPESTYVRVDTGVREGDEISMYYDPMIAKLIVWGESREVALARLLSALQDYHIAGTITNIRFLYNLAAHPAFKAAAISTRFIEEHQASLLHQTCCKPDLHWAVGALALILDQRNHGVASTDPWARSDHWRLNQIPYRILNLEIDGLEYRVTATYSPQDPTPRYYLEAGDQHCHTSGYLDGQTLSATIDEHCRRYKVAFLEDHILLFGEDHSIECRIINPLDTLQDEVMHGGFTAPMNGKVIATPAALNTPVKAGDTLIIMEAMKMEHSIKAPSDGHISEYFYAVGDLVSGGDTLLTFITDQE